MRSLGKRVILFASIATRITDRKHDDLLRQKNGRGYPALTVMDAKGEILTRDIDRNIAGVEKAGFYGVSVLKKTFWREVKGCKFYSVTVRGYKFEKKAGCQFVGQFAVYLGPQKAVIDEEGHLFPRGEAVEVCTDTAAKLSRAPYVGAFSIVDGPDGARDSVAGPDDAACCDPDSGCC